MAQRVTRRQSYTCRLLSTGVCKQKGRWYACICANGRNQHLGTYGTEEEAARAYDAKAKQGLLDPVLNFLPDGSLNPDRRKRKYVESRHKQTIDVWVRFAV